MCDSVRDAIIWWGGTFNGIGIAVFIYCAYRTIKSIFEDGDKTNHE